MKMPAKVRSALTALRREQAAARLRLGSLYDPDGLGTVFCDESGVPRWPQYVGAGFAALCEEAGLGPGWQPRELRHTFVSILSYAGVSIEDIADAAGHVNSVVTRTVYRHSLADEITTAALAMDKIFGKGAHAG